MPQEAEQYLKRHKQELDLLLIGSSNLGVPYIEGVSSQNLKSVISFFLCLYKKGFDRLDHYLLLDKMYAIVFFPSLFFIVV